MKQNAFQVKALVKRNAARHKPPIVLMRARVDYDPRRYPLPGQITEWMA